MFKAPINQSVELNRTLFGDVSITGVSIPNNNPFDVIYTTTNRRPVLKSRRPRRS